MRRAGSQLLLNQEIVGQRWRRWLPALLVLSMLVFGGAWLMTSLQRDADRPARRSIAILTGSLEMQATNRGLAIPDLPHRPDFFDQDDWLIEEIRQTNDKDLVLAAQELNRFKAEFDETLREFDRSQQIFYAAAASGQPLDEHESVAAHEKGRQIIAKLNDIEAEVFEKTSAVIARYYAHQTQALGMN